MKVSLIQGEGSAVVADITWVDVADAMRLRTRVINVLKSHKTEKKEYLQDSDLEDILRLCIGLTTRVEEQIVWNEKVNVEERVTNRIDILDKSETIDISSYLN